MLAGVILSILINPLLFVVLDRLTPWLKARERTIAAQEEGRAETPELEIIHLTDLAVLVGHGRVASLVAETLQRARQPYLVIEERPATVAQLRASGVDAISENAAQPGLLEPAKVASAR